MTTLWEKISWKKIQQCRALNDVRWRSVVLGQEAIRTHEEILANYSNESNGGLWKKNQPERHSQLRLEGQADTREAELVTGLVCC